jgi:hypothetical protein
MHSISDIRSNIPHVICKIPQRFTAIDLHDQLFYESSGISQSCLIGIGYLHSIVAQITVLHKANPRVARSKPGSHMKVVLGDFIWTVRLRGRAFVRNIWNYREDFKTIRPTSHTLLLLLLLLLLLRSLLLPFLLYLSPYKVFTVTIYLTFVFSKLLK